MLRLVILAIVLSFPYGAFCSVLFEENFDYQSDWHNSCRSCGKNDGWYNNGADKDGTPSGWDYWRVDEFWNPFDSHNPTPGTSPVMQVKIFNGAYSGGKSFIFTNESENDSPQGGGGGWSSDGRLTKVLSSDHHELYLQFRIRFQPNYKRHWIANNSSASAKLFRVYHWDRSGSPHLAGASGHAAPVVILGIGQNEYGAAFSGDAIRCDPQVTNYMCGGQYNPKAYFVDNSCGAITYPSLSSPSTDDSLLGLFDGNWHTIQLHVALNSSRGASDGVYEIWQNGCKIVSLHNVKYIGDGGDINAGWNTVDIGGNSYNNWLGITNGEYRDGAEQWYAIDDVVVSTSSFGFAVAQEELTLNLLK